MKKIVFIVFCFLFLPSFTAAQGDASPSEVQNLNRRIPALIQQGNFDELVSVAEKIAGIEKLGGEKNLPNYASALMNLALWKKQRLAKQPQIRLVDVSTESIKVLSKESEEIEKLFRELLVIFQNGVNDPARLAVTQSELARFLIIYYSAEENILEAGRLYEQSLALREKHLGADADTTLLAMLQLSDFYFQTGEFEKFSPLFQKYISAAEKKYGMTNRKIIPALRLYSNFLVTTDRSREADTILKQISALTGRTEIIVDANFFMFNRSASKIDNQIGAPQVRYTESSPIVMPNPTVVRRTRPNASGTYDRPPTTSGKLIANAPQIPVMISKPRNILVYVLIDEKGSVIEANPKIENEKVRKEIQKKVSKWKFKPFVYEGSATKMRGVVNVLYYKPISREKPKKDKKTDSTS